MQSIFIVLNEKNLSAVFPALLHSLFKKEQPVKYIIIGNMPAYTISGATDILHIPYPMGRENIDSYNEERKKKYSQRVLDVILWKAAKEAEHPLFVFTHHSQYIVAQTCRERISCSIAVCLENLHWQTMGVASAPCEHADETSLLQLADDVYTIDDLDLYHLLQLYPVARNKLCYNTIQPANIPATAAADIQSYGFSSKERLLFIDAAEGNMHQYEQYITALLSVISGMDYIRLVFNHTLNTLHIQRALRQLMGKTAFCPDAETAAALADISSAVIVLEPYSRHLALWRSYTFPRQFIIHVRADDEAIPSHPDCFISLSVSQTTALKNAIEASLYSEHPHLIIP